MISWINDKHDVTLNVWNVVLVYNPSLVFADRWWRRRRVDENTRVLPLSLLRVNELVIRRQERSSLTTDSDEEEEEEGLNNVDSIRWTSGKRWQDSSVWTTLKFDKTSLMKNAPPENRIKSWQIEMFDAKFLQQDYAKKHQKDFNWNLVKGRDMGRERIRKVLARIWTKEK